MRYHVKLLFVSLIMIMTACGGSSSQATPTDIVATPPLIATVDTELLGPTSVQPTIAPPTPASLTTAELNTRLDPFSEQTVCVLPCYNGLTPGSDSLLDTLVFYSQLGIGINDFIPGDLENVRRGTGHLGARLNRTVDILEVGEQTPPLVDIYIEDQIVKYIYVGWQDSPDFLTISKVVDNLGTPDQIGLGLDFSSDPATYSIQVIYLEYQTGFLFLSETQGDQSARHVCHGPGTSGNAYLGMFAPDMIPMEGLSSAQYVLPVEETLGISFDEFISQVTSTDCLTIPGELWTVWQNMGN